MCVCVCMKWLQLMSLFCMLYAGWTAAVHLLDNSSADVSGELYAFVLYDYLNTDKISFL